MATIDIYKEHYEEVCSRHDDEYSKYEWAANYIFDLITYDTDLDERFVKDILEVCEVIADRCNYEYIENNDNYIKYILVCQLLDRFKWINWGISIRGAWFENIPPHDSKNILDGNYYRIKEVPFSYDNLKALIQFMKEDTDND